MSPCSQSTLLHLVLAKYSQKMPTVIRKTLGQAALIFASTLSEGSEQGVGGELESLCRRPQVHLVESVLDRPLQDRRAQLVLGEVGVEEEAVVANLVPLAALPALAHPFVESSSRQGVRDRVADVVEGQAAREVDAADQRVGGLPQVADHEEARRLDPGRDACCHGRAGLVRCDALAAGPVHLLEQSLVHVRDSAEAFPRERQMSVLYRPS